MDNYEHIGRRFSDQNPLAINVAHSMQYLMVNLHLGWLQQEQDPTLLPEYGFIMMAALLDVAPEAVFLRPCSKPAFGFTFKVDHKVYRITMSPSGTYGVEKLMEVLS